jgi:hypothetical protein
MNIQGLLRTFALTAALASPMFLTPITASANGAVVLHSQPISITGIDNPCTATVENLTLSGFL